jgi:hypothetical protein
MTTEQLEREAQAAGEAMHEAVYRVALYEPDDEDDDLPEPEGIVCDGPCTTCIVREIAFAMWPYINELARRDLIDQTELAA